MTDVGCEKAKTYQSTTGLNRSTQSIATSYDQPGIRCTGATAHETTVHTVGVWGAVASRVANNDP